MPDENLTAALRATLASTDPENPLVGISPDTVDELIARIDQHLIDGLPDEILKGDLLPRAVDIFRAMALKWEQEEQTKTPRKKREPAAKVPGTVIDIEI